MTVLDRTRLTDHLVLCAHQAIANPWLGDDIDGMQRIILQLGSQMLHINAQIMAVALAVLAPHRINELGLGNHLASFFGQGGQQARQDVLAVHPGAPAPGEVVQAKDLGAHALHGAYWHDQWGELKSGGCVNLSPLDAQRVFEWTEPALPPGWHGARSIKELGRATRVVVRP